MGDLLWRHLQELPAFRALLRATEARLYAELPLPELVLDLGCGDGHFGAAALPRPPHAGLDPSERSLREARRLGFRVRRQEQKDGTIKLTLQGG